MSAEEPGHSPDNSEETYAAAEDERQKFFGSANSGSTLEARFTRGDLLADRFEIIRFLARGGMGEVYEARDQLLHGSLVALKTILPKGGFEADARTRLKQEVMLARQITHPNVCPIYDLFESDQPQPTCFLTMKLLHGETLAQRLRLQKSLALDQALLVTRQLCAALRAAHRAGVVHRDLKPGNVMLQGSGPSIAAVVTDFGIARELGADATISTREHVLGTPGYIAPEILRGSQATPATDLYALGVVLHEVFTGRKPRRLAKEPHAVSLVELNHKNVPAWCSRLIVSCLDADPEIRNREFQRVIQRLGIESQESQVNFGTRLLHRRTIFGIGAAAACLIGGGVLWEEDAFENILHPLPGKRFVALLEFPLSSDEHIRPLVTGAIEVIDAQLSRAEASDRNLFIVAAHSDAKTLQPSQLRTVLDPLGANLALAAQGTLVAGSFRLLLKLLDVSTGSLLRVRQVVSATGEIESAARRVVRAAAELLNVRFQFNSGDQPGILTHSEEAYKYFQTAEDLLKEPNDAGLDRALENYRAALDADPKYAIAYSKLAVAYCRLYSVRRDSPALDLARRNADTGLKLDRNLVYGHLALSSVYDHSGRKQDALAEIAKAVALDPTNPRTLLWQAQLYRRMNHWAEAEQIYRRILDLRPNYWPAYNDIGYVLNAQGRYKEALQAFQSATTAAPRSALAFNNLGDIFLKLGDFQRAEQSFATSLQLSPNPLAYANRGTALRAQGNYIQALPMYNKAVAISPSDDQNWLDLADCYDAMPGKQREALQAYTRAAQEVKQMLQVDQADGSAWMRLALYQVKTKQAADESIQKALSFPSPDLDSRVIQARIYERLGKRQAALAILRDCFKQGLTIVEVAVIPDLQTLRKDPAFVSMANASTNGGKPQLKTH